MKISLRNAKQTDLPFLERMLYEAVFWRANPNKPSFEEGMANPEVRKSVANWGKRNGDTAVIATVNATPVGAAWYRYWTDDNFIRGYIDVQIPALVIGVVHNYRRLGIGQKMLEWLINRAAQDGIPKISLMVSKDNNAIHLYKQQSFLQYADKGDSLLMVRQITMKTQQDS